MSEKVDKLIEDLKFIIDKNAIVVALKDKEEQLLLEIEWKAKHNLEYGDLETLRSEIMRSKEEIITRILTLKKIEESPESEKTFVILKPKRSYKPRVKKDGS